MKPLAVPHPSTRVPVGMYQDLRAWLLENDPDAIDMLEWSNKELAPPETPEKMAGEIKWIILCAGRSAQAARTLERRVTAALRDGRPVVEAFGYRAKAEAIERAWRERHTDFQALQKVLATEDPVALVEWCGSLPFVGDDTKFQLAKNFGADVVKPDIWLCRLSGIPDKPRRAVKYRFPACMALARPLAEATGDRVAAVDSLLWLACNKGVLVVDANAGPVTFRPKTITARSIYAAAGEVTTAPPASTLLPGECIGGNHPFVCDFCGAPASYAVTWERAQRAGLPVNIDSVSGAACALACKVCNEEIAKRAAATEPSSLTLAGDDGQGVAAQ